MNRNSTSPNVVNMRYTKQLNSFILKRYSTLVVISSFPLKKIENEQNL